MASVYVASMGLFLVSIDSSDPDVRRYSGRSTFRERWTDLCDFGLATHSPNVLHSVNADISSVRYWFDVCSLIFFIRGGTCLCPCVANVQADSLSFPFSLRPCHWCGWITSWDLQTDPVVSCDPATSQWRPIGTCGCWKVDKLETQL